MREAEYVMQQPAESDRLLALARQNGQRRVDRKHQHGTLRRSGDSIALASGKPKSTGDWTSVEPRCGGFWKQNDEKTGQKTRSEKTVSTTKRSWTPTDRKRKR